MEYKTNNEAQNNSYKMNMKETATAKISAQSALEKIASNYTKMPDVRSGDYNIDKCNCGNCGCIDTSWVLLLSPAGIAGSASAFGPISAF